MKKLKVLYSKKECKGFPLQKVANAAYKKLNQREKLFVELIFLSEEEIREVNKNERQIDKVTDVLSFPYLDGVRGRVLTAEDFGEQDFKGGYLLGSICICLKRAEEQALEYGHSLKREVCFLLLHGILHCFGYDHIEKEDEEEMIGLAEEIMNLLNIKRG